MTYKYFLIIKTTIIDALCTVGIKETKKKKTIIVVSKFKKSPATVFEPTDTDV